MLRSKPTRKFDLICVITNRRASTDNRNPKSGRKLPIWKNAATKPNGEKKAAGNLAKETVKGILTNPIILGIAGGMLLSVCHVPQVTIVSKTVHNLTSLATPLGLMAMGGSFEGEKAIGQIRPALGATFLRLAGIAMIALPLAALSGLRNEQMVGALVVAGSSSAVSCFIMAKNMGHEGTLTSSVVMLTTLGSAFTMTAWLYVLRCFGLV